jgi:tellurite resistance protein TerC
MNENILLLVFSAIVLVMLLLDLGIFNKNPHKVSSREALIWTIVWITVALGFSYFIYANYGWQKTSQYLAAYFVEKSLSVDNLFVFVIIFSFFKVPQKFQHKVLYWGIIGAIVLRAIFIFTGVWLIELTYLPEMMLFGVSVILNPILIFFGVVLLYAGIKTFSKIEGPEDFSDNWTFKLIKYIIPVSNQYYGGKFFTKVNGKTIATPLLACIAVIELTDLVFAIDSIPAIFGISKDPIILYTSNIFAILGLRALYFLLANSMDMFAYLKYGLGVILSYIGIKMILSDFVHIDSTLSLLIVVSILAVSIILSILKSRNQKANPDIEL